MIQSLESIYDSPLSPTPHGDSMHANVLVLNKYYSFVHICDMKRAIDLLYKEYAEVLSIVEDTYVAYSFWDWIARSQNPEEAAQPEPPSEQDWIRTVSLCFLAPRVIRLLDYDQIPRWEVKFSRRNLMLRDGHSCQYCGKEFKPSQLTIDHVVPRSRGGKTSWTNVVCACRRCNMRKGNRLPGEAGMRLQQNPDRPRFTHIYGPYHNTARYEIWKRFVS